MAIHKHNWVQTEVSIITGSGRKAPGVTMLFRCSKCKGTRTKDLKVRVPSNVALTDEQIWDRETERKMREQDRSYRKWDQEGLFEKEWIEFISDPLDSHPS